MNAAAFSEERRLLILRLGFSGAGGWIRGLIVHLGLIAAFGVAIPWVKGLDFFDPLILAAYACLGAVFAAPLAARLFDSPSGAHVDARVMWSVLYGEAISLVMIVAAIATVYWTHRGRLFFLPDLSSVAAAGGFGLVLSYTLATIGASLTLRFSPAIARGALRGLFLGLLVLLFLRGRSLLDQFGIASAVVLVFGLAFRFALRPAVRDSASGNP
jgi:hypothetical protein